MIDRCSRENVEKVDSYEASVPQDTRTRPSVDDVKPLTAPW